MHTVTNWFSGKLVKLDTSRLLWAVDYQERPLHWQVEAGCFVEELVRSGIGRTTGNEESCRCRSWIGCAVLRWRSVSRSCWRRQRSCLTASVQCWPPAPTPTPPCRWRTPPTSCVTLNSRAMPRDLFFRCRRTLPAARRALLLLTDSEISCAPCWCCQTGGDICTAGQQLYQSIDRPNAGLTLSRALSWKGNNKMHWRHRRKLL